MNYFKLMSRWGEYFVKTVDWFIPNASSLSCDHRVSYEKLYRARVVISISLISTPIIFSMFFSRLFFEGIKSPTLFLLPFAGLVLFLIPFYVRKTGDYYLIGVLLTTFSFWIMPIRTIFTGGITSAVAMWMALTPFLGTICISKRVGFWLGWITIFILFAIYKHEWFGLPVVPFHATDTVHFVTLALAFLSFNVFIFSYESLRVFQERVILTQAQDLEMQRVQLKDLNELQANMINSIGSGFGVIDAKGIFLATTSKSFIEHVNQNPAHQTLEHVFRLNSETAVNVNHALKEVLENHRPFDEFLTIAPKVFFNSRQRAIEIDYFPFHPVSGAFDKIVVVTQDSTEKFEAQKKTAKEKIKSEFVLKLASHYNLYKLWIRDTDRLIENFTSHFSRAQDLTLLRGDLHFLTGLFAKLGLSYLLEELVRIENQIAPKNAHVINDEVFISLHQQFSQVAQEYYSLKEQVRDLLKMESVQVYPSGTLDLESEKRDYPLLLALNRSSLPEAIREKILNRFFFVPIRDLLILFEPYSALLAEQKGRLLNPFIFKGESIFINPHDYQAMVSSLVSIFRFMVTTSIEDQEVRPLMGKDIKATITITTYFLNELKKEFVILIQDDGKKIQDLEKEKIELTSQPGWTELLNQVEILSGRIEFAIDSHSGFELKIIVPYLASHHLF